MASKKLFKVLIWGVAAMATPAFAFDINPYDWMPAPSGTNAAILYTPGSHSDRAIVNGTKLDASLNTALLVPRFSHYGELDSHPFVVSAILPMGRLWNGSIAGSDLGARTAVGDLTLAGAYWLVSKPQERKNLAIASYWYIPTGTYDRDKALNVSSGQYGVTLQLAGMVPLSEHFTLETTLDASFYRNKKNANPVGQTLSRDTSYSLQNWVSYSLSPTTTLSAGHAAYWGGTQKFDGIQNGFNAQKQQARIALNHWLTPTLSVYGQINRDYAVKGGFEGVSGLIRLIKVF
ncbi:transporter [Comamonas sp. w2-DMI]|uniref:transporter n=1 Tax=Comamonas sp. w2-DMI TaxID=3126391 RepID=UPI0032E36D52